MATVNIGEIIQEIDRKGMNTWLLDAFTEAFVEARKGKLKTYDEHNFEVNWIENIEKLRDAVLEERYRPGASKAFVVNKPMVREIFAAKFRDRIIHHFLFRMQGDWWDKRLIANSFSCRKGKGTLKAVKTVQGMMQSAISETMDKLEAQGLPRSDWRKPEYCPKIIKLDLSGYFMSLPRSQVYERIKWGLDRQFKDYMNNPTGFHLYKICEYLWKEIIFDDPVAKAIKVGAASNWDPNFLPPRKSLFCQTPGYGLVIGNLTSQLCSNVYLDALDRFVTQDLGYKRYGRYVDDFVFIVQADEYEQAKLNVKEIEMFLRGALGLTLHAKKRYMQDISKGLEFVGARIYPYCLYPSNRMQRNMRTALKRFNEAGDNWESIVSYFGLVVHLDSKKFVEGLLDEFEM